MPAELKELRDELGQAVHAMREAHQRMEEQEQKSGQVEQALRDFESRTQDHIDRIEERIGEIETARERAPMGRDGEQRSQVEVDHRDALIGYLRKGVDGDLADLEQKALSVQSDPDGGYWVTPDMNGRIVEKVFETSPVRQYASQQTIGTDALEGTADTDEAEAGWVSETESRTETSTPTIRTWRIPVHEIYAEPRATQKLLDDANVDVEQWLSDKVAARFGRKEASAFVDGDGNGKPRGFLTYPAGTSWQQIEQVNSGNSSDVTADGILDLVYSLKDAYLPNAAFFMRRTTRRAVRKLKDNDNQYLWAPGLQAGEPSTLVGHPVAAFEDMPAIGSNALAIAFGDLRRAYQIVDRFGIRVLRDPFTSKPYVKLYTTRRVGGDVVNFEAIKLQKIAS